MPSKQNKEAMYKIGDKVLITTTNQPPGMVKEMRDDYGGTVMTIRQVTPYLCYYMHEDADHWLWTDAMFSGFADNQLLLDSKKRKTLPLL